MTSVCKQCGKTYSQNFKVGNAHDGGTRTLCSMECYTAWLDLRQSRREMQEQQGLGGLIKATISSKVKAE